MRSRVLMVMMVASVSCAAQTDYELRPGSPDGIGKWYMGREIAHTMCAAHAGWLDRPEREREEQPARMVGRMEIVSTDVIADIGCGTGHHTLLMAARATQGKVYAVDIQWAMLDSVFTRSLAAGLDNVEVMLGTEQDPRLPEGRLDKVLMVDVYHEFAFPQEMMSAIVAAMRPGAMLFLVEFRGEDDRVPIKAIHRMRRAQAVEEMTAAGLVLDRAWKGLPWQHFLVFRKADH